MEYLKRILCTLFGHNWMWNGTDTYVYFGDEYACHRCSAHWRQSPNKRWLKPLPYSQGDK